MSASHLIEYNKRKVVADSFDTGDNARFSSLLASIASFISTPTENGFSEIENCVSFLETSMTRASMHQVRMDRESAALKKQAELIRKEKEDLERREAMAKERLVSAKMAIAHNEKCRSVVRKIKKLHTQAEYRNRITRVDSELEGMYVVQKKLGGKVELLRNKIEVMKNVFSRSEVFRSEIPRPRKRVHDVDSVEDVQNIPKIPRKREDRNESHRSRHNGHKQPRSRRSGRR